MRLSTEFTVKRDDVEIELTIEGSFLPAEWDVGIGEGAEVERVLLDGAPWTGELTEEEERAAEQKLLNIAHLYDDEP